MMERREPHLRPFVERVCARPYWGLPIVRAARRRPRKHPLDCECQWCQRVVRKRGLTREQYEQWCGFSLRMAHACYFGSRRPTRAWIVEHVRLFLSFFEDDFESVEYWDEGVLSIVMPGETGRPMPGRHVCDEFSEFADDSCAFLESQIWSEEEQRAWDQDKEVDDDRVADRVDAALDQWKRQWTDPVACCVRAGLDMVSSIGGGVVGFTLRDLRSMYPEGIPPFVRRHYDADLDALDDGHAIWL